MNTKLRQYRASLLCAVALGMGTQAVRTALKLEGHCQCSILDSAAEKNQQLKYD